jgi:hypothetical protein
MRSRIWDTQLQKLHIRFSARRDELMSTVEETVERDVAEQLFNQCKSLVPGGDEKVDDLAEIMRNCAIQLEIEVAAQDVTQMAALRRAALPRRSDRECIFAAMQGLRSQDNWPRLQELQALGSPRVCRHQIMSEGSCVVISGAPGRRNLRFVLEAPTSIRPDSSKACEDGNSRFGRAAVCQRRPDWKSY